MAGIYRYRVAAAGDGERKQANALKLTSWRRNRVTSFLSASMTYAVTLSRARATMAIYM